MNYGRWVDPRIHTVRLDDVRRYFDRRGWTVATSANTHLIRFEQKRSGRKKPLYLMAPAVEEGDDFPQRIVELITTLSELKDRHPVEVLNDVLAAEIADGSPNGSAGSRRSAKALGN